MTDASRPPLLIRTVLPAEAPAVAALHRRARATCRPDGPDDGTDRTARWRETVVRPDGVVLCAVRAGRLIALAAFHTEPRTAPDTVRLVQFHVDPDHWRDGVGTALHAACVEQWQAEGRRTAVLNVRVGNMRARRFWAARGWSPDPGDPAGEEDQHLVLRFPVPGRAGE
ncbi:GNAT family N-acetyltransferase [Streptomyces sp. NPDC005840]|uniref:GNAT family N-acetyltransferase n=1 Tax=Streptomyces sp. NPDC005840 TaxID=3157072 RepID=UPI0033F80B88